MPSVSPRPELARRILWEQGAVEQRFPGRLRLRRLEGRLGWVGTVPVQGRDFPVRVLYPDAYPAVPPSLETSLALPPNTPHLLGIRGGWASLCWISPRARLPHQRWQPDRHTAATVLRAAQRWALAFLVWQKLGRWPVPDVWEIEP